MKNNLTSKKGFTLIEILVVVSIIGLLASIVLVGLGGVRTRGRDAKRLADVNQVRNALELYYSKCGHYPGGANCDDSAPGTWGELAITLTGAGIGVSKIADDPTGGSAHYGYAVKTEGKQSYILSATLENGDDQSLRDSVRELPSDYSATNNLTTCAGSVYCVQF